MFKQLIATASVIVCLTGPQVQAAPFEKLGLECEQGVPGACERLVELTDGQCAGPVGSGCMFSLEVLSKGEWDCMTDAECELLDEVLTDQGWDWEAAPHMEAEIVSQVG